MKDDLIKPAASNLPVQQNAEKIVNVEKLGTLQQTNQFFVMNGIPGMPGVVPTAFNYSTTYYNLIVWGSEPFFEQKHVTITKDRALVEIGNITEELKSWLSPLTEEAIEALKTFPCIIANENKFYGKADEDQRAVLAFITDIVNRTNGIEIYFHPLYGIPQQRLNELHFELGINGTKSFSEFNHSHWTVKEINLMEVLSENGLKMI